MAAFSSQNNTITLYLWHLLKGRLKKLRKKTVRKSCQAKRNYIQYELLLVAFKSKWNTACNLRLNACQKLKWVCKWINISLQECLYASVKEELPSLQRWKVLILWYAIFYKMPMWYKEITKLILAWIAWLRGVLFYNKKMNTTSQYYCRLGCQLVW